MGRVTIEAKTPYKIISNLCENSGVKVSDGVEPALKDKGYKYYFVYEGVICISEKKYGKPAEAKTAGKRKLNKMRRKKHDIQSALQNGRIPLNVPVGE